jgi:hypothetical protein
MLCSKCQQKEATVHLTSVMDGVSHTEDFCQDCAPATGFEGLSPEQIMALSINGKKCEFCGKDAFSGVRGSNKATYWCFDCGREYGSILGRMLQERPDFMARLCSGMPSLFTGIDPETTGWAEAASEKAIQMMKDRTKRIEEGQDGV